MSHTHPLIIQAHQSEKVWAVLSGFSSIPADLQEELNGNRIHRLQNVITMETHSHRAFDDLRIWFKFQPVRFEHLYVGFWLTSKDRAP